MTSTTGNNEPEHIAVDINEETEEVRMMEEDNTDRQGVFVQELVSPTARINTGSQDYYTDFLQRAVQDTCRWAYGTVMVEVWVLNEERTHLERPPNGWWIDPVFHVSAHTGDSECSLCRLIDSSRPNYMEPAPLPPGVGLPGVLWAEAQRGNPGNQSKISRRMMMASSRPTSSSRRWGNASSRQGMKSGEFLVDRVGPNRQEEDTVVDTVAPHRLVSWRDVKALADDPDQPWNPRLKFLAECNLGWAAGIPFDMVHSQGIVVYMARAGTDFEKLSNQVNEQYLTQATLLIGAAYSLDKPRQAVEMARKAELKFAVQRLRKRIKSNIAFKKDHGGHVVEAVIIQTDEAAKPIDFDPSNRSSTCTKVVDFSIAKIKANAKKFLGGNVQAPPPMNWEQTAWTFFGAFTTLLVLTNINRELVKAYGKSHAIILG